MLFPLFSKWHLTKNESRGALAASQIERSGRPIRPVPRSPASCFSFTLENFGAGSAARFDYACSVLRLHHKSLSSFDRVLVAIITSSGWERQELRFVPHPISWTVGGANHAAS